MSFYLAVDIGASSGRHIAGRLHDGRLELVPVHRFSNNLVKKDGHLCWDEELLFSEILQGITKCKELGVIPTSVGIDTWGVDFRLLDQNGQALGNSVAYRDSRTDGMFAALEEHLTQAELYTRTGIQKQPFNTVYQLLATQRQQLELLAKAHNFLTLPAYFSYRLCGQQREEYTNASTSNLINVHTRNWDSEVISKLKLPTHLFSQVVPPGTLLGPLLPQIQQQVGFCCDVVLPCTHDTASAVVSAPIDFESLYLSSGTWSLMGAELESPIVSAKSNRLNFTNEGGYGGRYRFLKNIMGLWILQRIREEDGRYGFAEIEAFARQADGFPSRIDVNEHCFLAPENMTQAVRDFCVRSGQPVPESIGELAHCVYHSLAASYAQTVKEIEQITGRRYDRICVVGGGSKDVFLNELTAAVCGKLVTAGPVEATAIGNLLVQMIRTGEIAGLDEAREIVRVSFPITEY